MTEHEEEIASTMPADLDALPRLRGFRLRGMEMTRLETFIDATFAFAISMLVIAAQQIPDNIQALLAAFKNVPTFVCSIAVLGIYWRGHWLWSRRFGLEDGVSILISWMMIVTMLIFIYPLKAIFGAMWFLISSGRVGQPSRCTPRSGGEDYLRGLCTRVNCHFRRDFVTESSCLAFA
jgi:transmembrane protein TMEM174 (potassium channel)